MTLLPTIDIPINSLHIRKTDQGKEYIVLKGDLAFDETIIEKCRELGVKDEYIKEDNQ